MTAGAGTQGPDSPRPPGLVRLEHQLGWFEGKSKSAQSRYKWGKVVQLVLAAAVPVTVLLPDVAPVVPAVISAVVVVLEGVQQLYQWQANWLRYRATVEALRREQALFTAAAGPYRGGNADRLLAERVEDILQRENREWVDAQSEQTSSEAATKSRGS